MTPREHARTLGILMWVFAGLQLAIVGLIALFYTVIFGAMAAAIASEPHRPGQAAPPPPEAILGIVVVIMIIVVVVSLAFTIPKIVAGYGLRNGRSWAKVWTIVACVMAVMSVPLGTAVGVYGLWFVFGEAGKAFFDGPDFAGNQQGSFDPQPPPNSWQ